jgi:DNA repair exonuclease SbcCD ATPase subunit
MRPLYPSRHRQAGLRVWTATTVVLLAACETADREPSLTELRASRQELRLQFTALNNQIRGAEMQALDSPGVQAAQAEFRSALEARMVELDPQSSSWFAEAARLGDLIDTAPTDTTLTVDQKRRMAEDLQRLERSIRPVQTQAMQDSVVAARFRALQDSLVEMLMRIDPSTRPILKEMRQLEIQIQELDQTIARRSGSGPGSETPTR